jgi:hypothetical protein
VPEARIYYPPGPAAVGEEAAKHAHDRASAAEARDSSTAAPAVA